MDYLFRNKPSNLITVCGQCKNPIAPQADRWCALERVAKEDRMSYAVHVRCDVCFRFLEAIASAVERPGRVESVFFPIQRKEVPHDELCLRSCACGKGLRTETQKEPPAGNGEVPGERVYVPEANGGLSASLMVDNKRVSPTL